MKLAIFGAGVNGRILFEATQSNAKKVSLFLDDSRHKKEHCGLPVITTDEAPKDIIVYISIFQNRSGKLCSKDIKSRLMKKGFQEVYTFEEVYSHLSGLGDLFAKENYLWMRADRTQTIDQSSIDKIAPYFADEKSRNLLRQIVRFRESLSWSDYPLPEESIQYFPVDIPLVKKESELRFIDGGAFTGDSISSAREFCNTNNIEFKCVASFEPDIKNRLELERVIESEQKICKETLFSIYPGALWDDCSILKFKTTTVSSASCVDDDGVNVPAFSIDKTLYGVRPNYIKLDIEGAEERAIEGARNTIVCHKPVLAVCLYHKPKDLWEIPLKILDVYSDYNLYLRLYGHMGIELVLYAVPKERDYE